MVQVADSKASVNESGKSQELELNTMFVSWHSVSDITYKGEKFEYSPDLKGLFCSVYHYKESGSNTSVSNMNVT